MRILTFDLEEWFHILENPSTENVKDWEKIEARFPGNLEWILETLQKHNQPATFFCMGWMARRYPHLIRNVADLGYEVGCHSNMHQLVPGLTPGTYKQSLKDAIASIEDVTGKAVRSYRAPGFSIIKETFWGLEVLAECGIENDCSIFPAKRAHGGYPGFPVVTPSKIKLPSGMIREFPVNHSSVSGNKVIFSGGGYFRLMPYPLIRYLTKRSDYIMSYFHPRDFDPGQPRVDGLSTIRTFKSYVGLKGARKKFEKWLTEFEFTDLRTAVSTIDWTTVPTLEWDHDKNDLNVSYPPISAEETIAAEESSIELMGYTIQTKLDDNILRVTLHASRVTEPSSHIPHPTSHITIEAVKTIPTPLLINCMNPHSYCVAKKDPLFKAALEGSDILIPDGQGIVMASRILKVKKISKIAGADLHEYLLKKLDEEHGCCFYLGASQHTLDLIRLRLSKEYPNITAGFYSPPFKEEFTEEESRAMVNTVNSEMAKWRNGEITSSSYNLPNTQDPIHTHPASSIQHPVSTSPVLFIGLTAPKQEKWAYRYKNQLNVGIICGIGAVFDFYAGTTKRSSPFWIGIGLEWLPRFLKDPVRLYTRIVISAPLFLWDVLLYRVKIKQRKANSEKRNAKFLNT
ncbi:MAG: WecB/TagA/CpsF family glycosyltransferase [Bacteroidetes bacterium]|nr:WecB/TagA/CpsF family glycosyltransferase [Bacteroidota bacterium]